MDLNDRTVWITGASSGIGAALAQACLSRGAKLILTARREDALAAVRDGLQGETEGRVFLLPADLCDEKSRDAAAVTAPSLFGDIDVLINNAGVTQRSLVHETDLDVYRNLMEINYFAPVALTRSILPAMRKRGSGHIVMISSIAGHFGTPLRSGYCAAKSAVIGFSESLRLENESAGVAVTIVAPGFIRTPISESALEGDGSRHAKMDPAQQAGIPVEVCAERIAKAIERGENDVYIGGTEVRVRFIKRFAPSLFRRLIRRATVT